MPVYLHHLCLTVLLLHVMSVRPSARPHLSHRSATILTKISYKISFGTTLLHKISTYRFRRHRANIFIINCLSNSSFISFRLHIATRHACIRVLLIHRSLVVSTAWLSCCLFFVCLHVPFTHSSAMPTPASPLFM